MWYWRAQYEKYLGTPPTGRGPFHEYESELFFVYAVKHVVEQEALRQAAVSGGRTFTETTFADALPALTAQLPGGETWRALLAMTVEQRWVMYERYADLGQSYLRGLAMSVLAGDEPSLTFQATDLALAGGAAAITQLMVEKAAFRAALRERGYAPHLQRGLTEQAFAPAVIRAWEITEPALAGTETYLDVLERRYHFALEGGTP